ncbi:unnamed protein product [Symbiodinium natans]|uniref:Uncharacterized protein n=1 Tax=Symbiodinium natans TaxID=878477 RepID=A0A812G1H4_9DINO|nr:unnamed protein product [Symbiodinium natans]
MASSLAPTALRMKEASKVGERMALGSSWRPMETSTKANGSRTVPKARESIRMKMAAPTWGSGSRTRRRDGALSDGLMALSMTATSCKGASTAMACTKLPMETSSTRASSTTTAWTERARITSLMGASTWERGRRATCPGRGL